jgi:hypothetical protein
MTQRRSVTALNTHPSLPHMIYPKTVIIRKTGTISQIQDFNPSNVRNSWILSFLDPVTVLETHP